MDTNPPSGLDLSRINTPAFAVDAGLVEANCQVLDTIQKQTGAKILLALKGFSMYAMFPLIRKYLHGICASSVNEAILGRREFRKEVHSYSPAYSEDSLIKLLELSDHLVFNSPGQWERFALLRGKYADSVSFGLRINPAHSETDTPLYDPSAPFSRLGSQRSLIPRGFLQHLDGIHIHNLCEKNADALERTWAAVEAQFTGELQGLKWINLGGGHHITRKDYRIDLLSALLTRIAETYNVQVYLEPGEAVVLNTGFFVTTVLDIHQNQMDLAILDCSAPCHMPDVLEMPYRPEIPGAGTAGEKPHTYRLGGVSCLAGDVIGDYSFDAPLKPGDKLVFTDMAHYSMVKTTTFNGVDLPSLYVYDSRTGDHRLIKEFGYEDFKGRLS